jgi:peptidoglycan/LPS O-acetylase OafA/YrhL
MSGSASPTHPKPKKQGHRFAHIDAMRAAAVLIVAVSHAGVTFVPGGSGVTIFFVVSGFIITYLLLRERDRTGGFDIKNFYLRRTLKIFPPFVIIVILPTLIYSLFRYVNPFDVLGQILFFFNWRYTDGFAEVLPGSHLTWSLSIEEQFYLVFAAIWLFAVKSRHYMSILLWLASSLIIASALMRMAIYAFDYSHSRIYFGTDTRIEAIAIGVLAATWYFRSERKTSGSILPTILGNNWTLAAALVAFAASVAFRPVFFQETAAYSVQAWASALVLLYGLAPGGGHIKNVLLTTLAWRPIQIIGLASYSIYLVHNEIKILIEPWTKSLPYGLSVGAVLAGGLLVGVLSWKIVELPAQRLKERLQRPRSDQKESHPLPPPPHERRIPTGGDGG